MQRLGVFCHGYDLLDSLLSLVRESVASVGASALAGRVPHGAPRRASCTSQDRYGAKSWTVAARGTGGCAGKDGHRGHRHRIARVRGISRVALRHRSRPRYRSTQSGQRLPLCGCSRCDRSPGRRAEADPRAGDSARVARRLDLVPTRAAICRRPAATHAGASSTAITRAGARCATKPSTTASSSSPRRCRRCGDAPAKTSRSTDCRAAKVVAALVQLLEKTLIRVGNAEYARDNQSFGLTTLRDGHARISGSTIRFRFKGKAGKFHDISFSDARLARIVKRCQELPGRELVSIPGRRGTRSRTSDRRT